MTRQRRWQIKMKALGRCTQCGAFRVTRSHCRTCADKMAQLAYPRMQAWYAADPQRKIAHNALNRAVKIGLVVRPVACSKCGKPDAKINADHHDYSQPLDVTWLCYVCHRRVTEERRAAGAAP